MLGGLLKLLGKQASQEVNHAGAALGMLAGGALGRLLPNNPATPNPTGAPPMQQPSSRVGSSPYRSTTLLRGTPLQKINQAVAGGGPAAWPNYYGVNSGGLDYGLDPSSWTEQPKLAPFPTLDPTGRAIPTGQPQQNPNSPYILTQPTHYDKVFSGYYDQYYGGR